MKTARSLALTLLSVSALAASALAQAPAPAANKDATTGGTNNGGNRGNNNNNGGGRGNFDPAEMVKRMEDRLKTSLKASDEEWTVLQPLIANVVTKQFSGGMNRFGGGFGGGRGGNNNGGGNTTAGTAAAGTTAATTTPRPGREESDALRTTLENESASPEEIKAKLAAVRDHRKKSNAELAQAREELRKVLTVRQEAVLVSSGILE